MKIESYKIERPLTLDIKLDYKDIAKWFETASSVDIKMAINEIGLTISKNEEENPFYGFSRHALSKILAPKSRDFWKSLLEEI